MCGVRVGVIYLVKGDRLGAEEGVCVMFVYVCVRVCSCVFVLTQG